MFDYNKMHAEPLKDIWAFSANPVPIEYQSDPPWNNSRHLYLIIVNG